MADSEAISMVDPSIFKSLQNTIDKDTSVREKFKDILQTLDKQGMYEYIMMGGCPFDPAVYLIGPTGRTTLAILSRAHSLPPALRMFNNHFFFFSLLKTKVKK